MNDDIYSFHTSLWFIDLYMFIAEISRHKFTTNV